MNDRPNEPIHVAARKIGTDLFEAACTLQEADYPTPAAMIAYSAIDVMASLVRPAGQENVTRKDFKRWADEYLLPLDEDPAVTAADLYGARCGLLHTHSPKSSLSRAGDATPIWYTVKDTPAARLRKIANASGQPVKVLHLGDLLANLYEALVDFWEDLETDGDLAARAESHRSDLLRYYPFGGDEAT